MPEFETSDEAHCRRCGLPIVRGEEIEVHGSYQTHTAKRCIAYLRQSLGATMHRLNELESSWRCFYCNELFKEPLAAARHFGSDDGCYSDGPACKLNEQDGGILELYRRALDEISKLQSEDSPTHLEFYALGAEHHQALIDAEQAGYDRGLKDARIELERGKL